MRKINVEIQVHYLIEYFEAMVTTHVALIPITYATTFLIRLVLGRTCPLFAVAADGIASPQDPRVPEHSALTFCSEV